MDHGPGAQLAAVLAGADDSQLQALIGPEVYTLLLTVLHEADPQALRRSAADLVDLLSVLRDADRRQTLLGLLPQAKQAEFHARTGTDPATTTYTKPMLRLAAAFFGVQMAATGGARQPPTATVDPSYGLFEHQRRAAARIRDHLRDGPVLLHLPTGVGKTRTAMSIISDFLRAHEPAVVVWLAAGEELLEQAANEFERTWGNLGNRPVTVVRCWGAAADLGQTDINDGLVVLGLQKAAVGLNTDDDALNPLGPRARLVVFDEAHQAIAPTYRRVTDRLTVSPQARLLGLSATPGRTWADIDRDSELSAFFGQNKVTLELGGHDNPITALTAAGYLARPTFESLLVEPGTQMSEEDRTKLATAIDIPRHRLDELATDQQWNLKVLEAVTNLAADHRRILVFAASVRHCQILASLLTASNFLADYVTADSSPEQRSAAIRRFTNPYGPDARVLINYGVLTTGFDAPQASAAVIARPTLSLVLYSQMVGRVLRGPRAGGTETCEIVTVVDTTLPGFGDIAQAFTNWDDVWRPT